MQNIIKQLEERKQVLLNEVDRLQIAIDTLKENNIEPLGQLSLKSVNEVNEAHIVDYKNRIMRGGITVEHLVNGEVIHTYSSIRRAFDEIPLCEVGYSTLCKYLTQGMTYKEHGNLVRIKL